MKQPGKHAALAALLAGCLLWTGCRRVKEPVVASAPPLPTAVQAPEQTLPKVREEDMLQMNMLNAFSLRLFQKCAREEGWLVSPLNVALAIGQLRPGAQEETASQMDQTLSLHDIEGDTVWTSMAALRESLGKLGNGTLWQGWGMVMGEGPSLRVQYRELMEKSLGSQVLLLDYASGQAAESFHAWVKQASGGLITAMPEYPTENVPLTVMTATALDGRWKKAFNEKNVRGGSFTVSGGQKVSADYMTTKIYSPVLADGEVTLTILPLDGGLEAWLLLPPEEVGLADFARGLTLEQLATWRGAAEAENCLVTVPQMDLSMGGSLLPQIKAMGMTRALNAAEANFSQIGAGVYLGEVLAASRLRLGLEGVESADEPMSRRMVQGMDRELKGYGYTRPFLLLVTDTQSGSLVLMAGVNRPTKGQ